MINLEHIRHIIIILTTKCNMDCVYCIQGGKNRKLTDNTTDTQITADKLCTYFSRTKPLEIVFFGGEPLLNWDYLVACSKAFKSWNPQCTLKMVTNGSLLTQEKIDIINELDIWVTISHDGVAQTTTRSPVDILDVKGELISKINRLGFISTITVHNYDLYKNWEYFESWRLKYNREKRPACNITGVRDLGGNMDSSLLLFNNKEFESVLDKVMNDLRTAIVNRDFDSYSYRCFKRTLQRLYWEGTQNHGVTPCLSKHDILVIDTTGTIYRCHNNPEVIDGNITRPDTCSDIINTLDTRCRSCDIKQWCPKCPMVHPDKRNQYCWFQRAVTMRLLNLLEDLASEEGWWNENSST